MSGSFGADAVAHKCLVHITRGHPTPNPQAALSAPAVLPPARVCLQPLLPFHRLEISSLNKTIRITAKSTKRIREALQPVLGKYGVRMELALLRRVRARASAGTAPASCTRDAAGGGRLWVSGQGLLAVTRRWGAVIHAGGRLWACRESPVFEMGHGTPPRAGRDQWVCSALRSP